MNSIFHKLAALLVAGAILVTPKYADAEKSDLSHLFLTVEQKDVVEDIRIRTFRTGQGSIKNDRHRTAIVDNEKVPPADKSEEAEKKSYANGWKIRAGWGNGTTGDFQSGEQKDVFVPSQTKIPVASETRTKKRVGTEWSPDQGRSGPAFQSGVFEVLLKNVHEANSPEDRAAFQQALDQLREMIDTGASGPAFQSGVFEVLLKNVHEANSPEDRAAFQQALDQLREMIDTGASGPAFQSGVFEVLLKNVHEANSPEDRAAFQQALDQLREMIDTLNSRVQLPQNVQDTWSLGGDKNVHFDLDKNIHLSFVSPGLRGGQRK